MKKGIKIILIIVTVTLLIMAAFALFDYLEEETFHHGEAKNLPAVNDMITENGEYTIYENTSGVKFAYPSTWVSLEEDEEMPWFIDSQTGNHCILFAEDLPGEISFEEYIEISKTKIPNFTKIKGDIKQEELNLNGRKAYKLTYESSTTEDPDVLFTAIQITINNENKVWTLMLGAQSTKLAEIESTFHAMISSFKVVEK